MKKIQKWGMLGLVTMLCTTSSMWLGARSVFAATKADGYQQTGLTPNEDQGLFPSMDANGNVTYIKLKNKDITKQLQLPEKKDKNTTFEVKRESANGSKQTLATYHTFAEANAAMMRQSLFRSGGGSLGVYTNNQVRSVVNGVVNFATKSCDATTLVSEDATNQQTAINGCYGADAAYLGTNADGTKVKFKMAGITGWVNKSDVQILDYDNDNAVKSVNYYEVSNGRIYHNITTDISLPYYTSTIDVGPAQSYMKNGDVYYSYDGHYFYRTYAQMIADYRANTFQHAINSTTPYYNYYQFLSFRSKSDISANDFNNYMSDMKGSSSKLYNQGQYYQTYQNTYGVNAGLVMGVSINESAYGMSNLAQQRNNIFGLRAYDSNPNNATSFPSVAECIRQFMQTHVSINYTDPNDVSGLYHGACLGDKSVGMGVKYATAPYWGETNASFVYNIQKHENNTTDYGKYTIGIKEGHDDVNIRKDPNTASSILYRTGPWANYPFIILDTVQGERVDGDTTWYKIATDAPLASDRSKALQFYPNAGGEYDPSISYAYVSAKYVQIVSKGNTSAGQGDVDAYQKGDVNGDGMISASDYTLVKKYVLGLGTLNGKALKAADVNGDGIVSASDYTLIKKIVLGL